MINTSIRATSYPDHLTGSATHGSANPSWAARSMEKADPDRSRKVRGDLRGPADPVQQIRHPAQGVADPEQAADQRRDPGQGPPLIGGPVGPLLRGRAPVQLVGEPVELGVAELAHRPARAAGGQRRRARRRSRPAATRGPTSGSPATARRSRPSEAAARTSRWPATAPAPARLVPEPSGRHHRHTS